MSAEAERLKQQIRSALARPIPLNDPSSASAVRDQLANEIATAVDAYVTAKLALLKTALVTPGAYVGAGTGAVTVTATGLAGYNPD